MYGYPRHVEWHNMQHLKLIYKHSTTHDSFIVSVQPIIYLKLIAQHPYMHEEESLRVLIQVLGPIIGGWWWYHHCNSLAKSFSFAVIPKEKLGITFWDGKLLFSGTPCPLQIKQGIWTQDWACWALDTLTLPVHHHHPPISKQSTASRTWHSYTQKYQLCGQAGEFFSYETLR